MPPAFVHDLECDCSKDPGFSFGCKNGVTWFTTNVLIMKIRRKQKMDKDLDVRKVVNEEYDRCKLHFKSLKKLKVKDASA